MKNVSKRDVCERVLSGYDNDLMEAGITERRLAQKLKEELNAKKSMRSKLIAPGDQGVSYNRDHNRNKWWSRVW